MKSTAPESLDVLRDNIKHRITQRGTSISALCRKLKISRPSFSRFLSGNSGISMRQADKIAGALGVSLHTLLRRRK